MSPSERKQMKDALDDAWKALNDLGTFTTRMTIDVRNITKDIQTTGTLSVAEIATDGASLKQKSSEALRKVGALHKLAEKHFGGGE